MAGECRGLDEVCEMAEELELGAIERRLQEFRDGWQPPPETLPKASVKPLESRPRVGFEI